MRNFLKNKSIFWDFDGVILDSMNVRDEGFVSVLQEEGCPERQIMELLSYHRTNGGLSRYVKFRYFYENIRNEDVTDDKITDLANRFSRVMLDKLCDTELLICDTIDFIKAQYKNVPMHVVSGSDQKELQHICNSLHINQYFRSIHGSPTPKVVNVKNMLNTFRYHPSNVVLIGDSINDLEAAVDNDVTFFGYNNEYLKNKGNYITSFGDFVI